MSTQNNEPDLAFPFWYQGPTTGPEVYYGMSKRFYAAVHIAAGMVSTNGSIPDAKTVEEAMNRVARGAFLLAEALIKEESNEY